MLANLALLTPCSTRRSKLETHPTSRASTDLHFRLLPTNGLRACTACPSEVSWNSSEDPEELYRAEVEFITVEDWRKELKIILDDLLNDNGEVSKDCTNGDTEAGLAYAKIKAVYPHMTREDISFSSVDGLAGYGAVSPVLPQAPLPSAQVPLIDHHANSVIQVRTVLGSTKKLRARTSSDLYAGLQRYVDSKEKTVAQGPPRKDATMEYWPLIKVVRIYVSLPSPPFSEIQNFEDQLSSVPERFSGSSH